MNIETNDSRVFDYYSLAHMHKDKVVVAGGLYVVIGLTSNYHFATLTGYSIELKRIEDDEH
ncbi:TMhelix containing protein [Vibrio phage 1.134.O._10N.222.52.B8]|nr:TMhelix containing protein [Vibrio phage 1.134.O._10N.222.52.B8]